MLKYPAALRRSPRLQAILSYVKGSCLADIGTDHAFLPIAACLDNIVEKAVACDLCPGPLDIARENIRQYGLTNRIDTRLAYGLQGLKTGEADCVVISGLGGMNIIEILKDAEQIASSAKRLILQPQRDIPLIQQVLIDLNFKIIDEATVLDKGRSYTIIAARPRLIKEER